MSIILVMAAPARVTTIQRRMDITVAHGRSKYPPKVQKTFTRSLRPADRGYGLCRDFALGLEGAPA